MAELIVNCPFVLLNVPVFWLGDGAEGTDELNFEIDGLPLDGLLDWLLGPLAELTAAIDSPP